VNLNGKKPPKFFTGMPDIDIVVCNILICNLKICSHWRQNMITVIENKDFIEGIFQKPEEAEKYLLDHPQKEKCILKNTYDNFPFYVVEKEYGKFIYFSTKDEIITHIKNMDLKERNKSKMTEEINITIYIIKGPYISETKNKDAMGILEHYHIEQEVLNKIKNGNNNELKI
jgi:hypothetical protein